MPKKHYTGLPGRPFEYFEKNMLENLIKKYKKNDIEEVVYRLTYFGKFIIIKGKTLCGSLMIIADTYNYFNPKNKKHENHLYKHLYNHYRRHPNKRFTIKVIAKKDKKTSQYDILKREQMELDRNRYNKLSLNNAIEPYIPNFNELTGKYGWIEKQHVMNFKRYQASKARALYIKRYCNHPDS